MKKVILCLGVYLICSCSAKVVIADETGSSSDDIRLESYISGIYHQIDFNKCTPLPYEVFDKAYHGYLNLKIEGKLSTGKEILTVCDLELASTENRMWIIDLDKKKVLYNTYVAHGQGSGEDYAQSFSNESNTHKTSLGFYVTGETYDGEHGTSLRLTGMDEGYNDAAMDRGIVVHGADYVSDKFIKGEDHRLGRSWGCPAVSSKLSLPIINTIKDSTCLFIYYPEHNYLKTSYWLNKRVAKLPENDIYAAMPAPRTKVIQYITNGKVDSVVTIPAQAISK